MTAMVTDIYRYPVKGLSGERLPNVEVQTGQTILGDRMFALGRPGLQFDTQRPVWIPKTNFLALVRDARLAELSTRFDDTTSVLTVSQGVEELLNINLSQANGRSELEQFLAKFLSDKLSGTPTLLKAEGHSFSDLDDKVVSFINLESVRDLELQTGAQVDPIRFRGNIYFKGTQAWSENDWVGRKMTIGETRLKIIKRTRRCAATNVNPTTALRDMNIPATLQKTWGHSDLGFYARVIRGGMIRAKDSIKLER